LHDNQQADDERGLDDEKEQLAQKVSGGTERIAGQQLSADDGHRYDGESQQDSPVQPMATSGSTCRKSDTGDGCRVHDVAEYLGLHHQVGERCHDTNRQT